MKGNDTVSVSIPITEEQRRFIETQPDILKIVERDLAYDLKRKARQIFDEVYGAG